MIGLGILVDYQLAVHVRASFWTLKFILLVSESILMPIPHCFDFFSFVVCCDIGKCESSFVIFKVYLLFGISWNFIRIWESDFSICALKAVGILIGTVSNLEITAGSIVIFILCVSAQLLSFVLLFATSWTVACQVPLSMGFPKREYWNGLLWSRDWTHISCTGKWILYHWATWEAHVNNINSSNLWIQISPHLLSLLSFHQSVLCFSVFMSCISLASKYFIHFDAVANTIVLLDSCIYMCLSSVCWSCILQLCWIHLWALIDLGRIIDSDR